MVIPRTSGSSGGTKPGGRGRPGKNNALVVHNPVAVASTSVLASQAGTSASTSGTRSGGAKTPGKVLGAASSAAGGSKSSSSASKSSSSSSSTNEYLAEQKKQARRTRNRYIEDAERLGGQVTALQEALGKGAFRKALKTKLRNLDEVLGQQLGALDKGFGERWGSLEGDARNNEIAAGDSSNTNEGNRIRERSSALAEIAMQGAGESDGLRAQLMSLRSFDNNQNEINRAYADSARSIQNSRVDLVSDTRTAMQNVWLEADADRSQLWNDFHAQQSESWTSLGNALGQQAEYLGLAKAEGAGGGRVSLISSSGGNKGKGKGKGKNRGYNLGSNVGFTGPGSGVLEEDRDYYDHGVRGDTSAPWRGLLGGPRRVEGRPNSLGMSQPGDNDGGKGRGGKGRGGKGRGGKGTVSGGRQKLGPAMEEAENASDEAFIKATNQIGKAYKSKGLPDRLQNWDREIPEAKPIASSFLQNARTVRASTAPEGATLRKW